MEEEAVEDMVGEAEVGAEAMVVEAVVAMEGAVDTGAARAAEEASNATGAQYL